MRTVNILTTGTRRQIALKSSATVVPTFAGACTHSHFFLLSFTHFNQSFPRGPLLRLILPSSIAVDFARSCTSGMLFGFEDYGFIPNGAR